MTGRVQGVWFRGSTQRKALALGISGYARNLADGRVEVVLAGEAGAVSQLQAWLQQGPPAARVDRLECEELDGCLAAAASGFSVR